jgi:Flp pilus assembly protein TadB
MPLSEHEERILAEIERQLEAEDPRFAARSRRPTTSLSWSRTVRLRLAVALGVLGVLGVLLLIVSVAFAAVGLVLIFGAIVLAATAVREQVPSSPSRTPSPDDAL